MDTKQVALFATNDPVAESGTTGAEPHGRDELSLIELAFTTLGRTRTRKTLKTEWVGRDHRGKRKRFTKVVTGSDEYGLPEYQSEELMIALFHRASRSDFEERRVSATPLELLRLMEWGTSGRSYLRLQRALDQLAGVYIKTNALWNEEAGTYSAAGFHIIESYEISADATTGRKRLEVVWNEKLFALFQQQRFKRLDTAFFYSLPSPVAKRLYRWLDKHLHQNGHAEIDVLHLAHVKLEVSRSKRYVSQVMQVLEPALVELNNRRYCKWDLVKSKTESGKKLVFERIDDAPTSKHELEARDADLSPGAKALSEALMARGLARDNAERLTQTHKPERIVRQMAHYDFLVETGSPPRSAGFLTVAIEEDYAIPPALIARQQRSEAKKNQKASQTAQDRREEAQRQKMTQDSADEENRITSILEALTDEERSVLESKAVASAERLVRERYAEDGLKSIWVRAAVQARMVELLESGT